MNSRSWSRVSFDTAFADRTSEGRKIKQINFQSSGRVPIVDQGADFVAGYSDECTLAWSGPLPVIVFGDHTRAIKYVDFPFILGADGVKVLVPARELLARFAYHYLQYLNIPSHGYSRHFKFLKEFPIPVPPLAEQERIVKLLDDADELRKLRTQADQRTATLIPALFHEIFGDPTRNPKKLPVITMQDAGRVQLGRQRAPKYQSGNFTRPYVRVANVFENRIDVSDLLSMDFNERDFQQYRLEQGDILLNEGQSTELVGRPAMWRGEVPNCCFQNTLLRFQPDRTLISPDYALALCLTYYREGAFARISSKTSNVAHLGAARFASMPFLLPPLALQQAFAAHVAEIRQLEARQAASRQRLDALFQSMLHRAFNGEL